MWRAAMLRQACLLAPVGLVISTMFDMTTPVEEHEVSDCHVGSLPTDSKTQCQNLAMLQKSAVREHTVLPMSQPSAGTKHEHLAKESLATASELIEEAIESNKMPQLLELLKKKMKGTKAIDDETLARRVQDIAHLSNVAPPKSDISPSSASSITSASKSSAKKVPEQHKIDKYEEASVTKSKAREPKERESEEDMSLDVDNYEEELSKAASDKHKSTDTFEAKSDAGPVKHVSAPSTSPTADIEVDKAAISRTQAKAAHSKKAKATGTATQKKDMGEAAVPKKKDTEEQTEDEEQLITTSAVSTVDGSKAALDKDGYSRVVKLQDKAQMKKFLHRVVRATGFFIADEGKFDRTLAKFNKRKGGHHYADVIERIGAAAAEHDSGITIAPPNAKASARPSPIDEPDLGPGLTVPLNQDGYLEVAELKSASQMTIFIQRVINRLGFSVKNKYGLQGIVPWFSGESATQSYRALKIEIQNTAMTPGQWVIVDEPSL